MDLIYALGGGEEQNQGRGEQCRHHDGGDEHLMDGEG